MTRIQTIDLIRQSQAILRELGVHHLSLFGSVARGQEAADSDVDVIVDTADGQALGLFGLARVSEELEARLGRSVDVISRRGLEHAQQLKQRIAADIVDVF